MEQSLSKYRTIHVAKKKLWTPARKGFNMEGLVSDIKVWDNFNPLTGEGKLVDYHKGGHNTISSGATAEMLEYMFSITVSSYSTRYYDGTYWFPCIYDFIATGPTSTTTASALNPMNNLFGNIMGLKGASAGLTGKQSVLSNLNIAWDLHWNGGGFSYTNGDQYLINGAITKSITMTRTIQTAGQPAQYQWNVTVTSSSSAQPYTIDSIGWIPASSSSTWYNYFLPASANPAGLLTQNSTAPNLSSQNATPTNVNLYITALFVLPYLVTVNPNGAFQFTYTFQGN